MILYADSKSRLRLAAGMSEEFRINVGVHQGSALSPLLFILVIDEATKECRVDEIWELLYADDLALTAETKEEAEQKFFDWRQAMARRGMLVNVAKTNAMVTGKNAEVVRSGRHPCAVCGKGVGQNSILCTACGFWYHNRCSGVCHINSTTLQIFNVPPVGVKTRWNNLVTISNWREGWLTRYRSFATSVTFWIPRVEKNEL